MINTLKRSEKEFLWAFSERVFAQIQVKRILLELQDTYQLDVDIALWCCWLEVNAICLAKDTLEDAQLAVGEVNQSVLSHLRTARRSLRNSGGFSSVQERVICKQILSAELMIEKVLIHRLQNLTDQFRELMSDKADPLSLEYYLETMSVPNAVQVAISVYDACLPEAVLPLSKSGFEAQV